VVAKNKIIAISFIAALFLISLVAAAIVTESSGLTPNTNVETQSGKSGLRIKTNQACNISSITTETGGTTAPTKVYVLYAGNKSVIDSASISGVSGTFSSVVQLASNTEYVLAVDNDGSSYTLRKDASASSYFPNEGTYWNWTGGMNWNGDIAAIDPWAFAIVSANVSIADVDTCTCAGLNTNWEVNMSDHCIITDACDLGNGNLTFVGSGNFTVDAVIDLFEFGDPGANGIIWMNDEGVINVN